MLKKSINSLAPIPELAFKIDLAALNNEISNKSDDSPVYNYVSFYISFWLFLKSQSVPQFPHSKVGQFEINENRSQTTDNSVNGFQSVLLKNRGTYILKNKRNRILLCFTSKRVTFSKSNWRISRCDFSELF